MKIISRSTERKSSVSRRVLSRLLSVIPDKLVYAVSEELSEKQCRARQRLINHYGKNFFLARTAIIVSPDRVTFGDDCAINDFVHIRGSGTVHFGNGVWVANSVTITSESHPSDVEYIGDHPPVNAPVHIEDNTWIGSGAIILPGITLGQSCIVGAGSVVTKDVPPYAIVVGVPAKVLRYKKITDSFSILYAHCMDASASSS